MKKLSLLLISIFLVTAAQAQTFSFEMYFTDAAGNTDTITLGYDPTATDSIDAAFGEVNIIGTPLDSGLDVRVSNKFEGNGTIQLKKQIFNYTCGSNNWQFPINAIDIYTKSWPVTANWNLSLFTDSCREGSVFTSMHPGGWWDVGSPSDLYMKRLTDDGQITFSSNMSGLGYYGYITPENDTVATFWQAFGGLSLIISTNDELSREETALNIYPNPAAGLVTIGTNGNEEISKVELIDVLGKTVLTSNFAGSINIQHLPAGFYFVKAASASGKTAIEKLQKL